MEIKLLRYYRSTLFHYNRWNANKERHQPTAHHDHECTKHIVHSPTNTIFNKYYLFEFEITTSFNNMAAHSFPVMEGKLTPTVTVNYTD